MTIVFLDVDGTLLPFGAPSAISLSNCKTTDSPLLGRVDPGWGPRLTALNCNLVWATSWMGEANEVIGPLLGLPRLPVLDWPDPSTEDSYFKLHPKTRALVKWADGNAFAWVDDEITDSDREWVAQNHAGPALLMQVAAHSGLTETNFGTLEEWVQDRTK